MDAIQLPYGDGHLNLEVPNRNLLEVIYPRKLVEESRSEAEIIRQALDRPLASPPLRSMAHPGQKVAIITSDLTRPCPSNLIIPIILDELASAGVPDEDITIIIGTGLHRKMTPAEISVTISPQLYQRIRTLNHDLEDTKYLGVTRRGTPVAIFTPLVEADLRICLGVVEFHWYAGFSGGAKAVFPGCASRASILANHALMIQPGVGAGRIDENPLRLDLEEGCSMVGVDFLLNVLVEDHRVVAAVAGDLKAAHRRGCELVTARGSIQLPSHADIVVASAGGFPKDINLFQAHKAMEHASYALRDGGHLVMVAECREGFGNSVFENWIMEASSIADLRDRFRRGFVMGGHKALAIANLAGRVRLSLVSGLPDDLVKKAFMAPYPSPQSALDQAIGELGPVSQVMVFPVAGSTVPLVGSDPPTFSLQ